MRYEDIKHTYKIETYIPATHEFKEMTNRERMDLRFPDYEQVTITNLDDEQDTEEDHDERGPFGGAFASWEDYYSYRGAHAGLV